MLPLALSGTPIIAAAVSIGILLVIVLFRAENRYEAEDRAAERARAKPPSEPHP